MAKTAICIRCGEFKSSYAGKCLKCEFEPKEELDVAKSRILGKPWSFAVGTQGEVVETGRSKQELSVISAQIKAGVPYDFPDDELTGVLTVYREMQTTTPAQLIWTMVRWLAPPALVGAAVLAIILWKR